MFIASCGKKFNEAFDDGKPLNPTPSEGSLHYILHNVNLFLENEVKYVGEEKTI
jgi:hypothetical protein